MSDSFVFYRSFHEALKDLSREQYGNIMFAINDYALNKIEPELSGVEKIVFTLVKPQLDANMKRQEEGKKGGRPRTSLNTEKPAVSEKPKNQKPMVSENEENKKPNDNENENLNDNDNLNSSGETAGTEKPDVKEKTEKKPLLDREPKNDIEKVEKLYLENYTALKNRGLVKTDMPVVNWSQSRKLTKDALEKYGLDSILDAVKNSMNSEFCIQKGYCLTTILSSGVLAGLINGNSWKQSVRAIDKVDHPDDMGEILF